MRKPLIAGNWKMNMTHSDTLDFLPGLADLIQTSVKDLSNVEVAVGTPFLNLQTAVKLNGGFIKIMSQNVSQHESGAFTGEISIDMLRDIGVSSSIVGHSERRQYFNETDESVAAKTKALIDAKFLAVTCVGETLEEREGGQVEQVIERQVTTVLDQLSGPSEHLVIAYEPVWAIGTGKTATKEQAEEVHAFIRSLLEKKWGHDEAQKTRILYGGSVKPSNAKELLSMANIDGALVGGASLKIEDFTDIVAAAV